MKKLLALILILPVIAMATDQQKISTPTTDDLVRLNQQREVVEKYLSAESKEKYKTVAGKLGLLRALITSNTFKQDETYKLQCMGIVLGDAFVQELKMEWIMVEDSYGRDPAIRMPETSVIIYPLTMISKRIEKGEQVDVFDLFNGIANLIEDKVKEEKLQNQASEGTPSGAPPR